MAPFVGPNELLQRLEKLEKLVEDGETKKFRIVTADAIIVIVLIIVFVMTIEYYWIVLNSIEYYWLLLNTIEYYWILLNIS